MMLEMDQRERQVLEQVVRSALGTVREEMYKTETTDYEAQPREREQLLVELERRVSALAAVEAPATS